MLLRPSFPRFEVPHWLPRSECFHCWLININATGRKMPFLLLIIHYHGKSLFRSWNKVASTLWVLGLRPSIWQMPFLNLLFMFSNNVNSLILEWWNWKWSIDCGVEWGKWGCPRFKSWSAICSASNNSFWHGRHVNARKMICFSGTQCMPFLMLLVMDERSWWWWPFAIRANWPPPVLAQHWVFSTYIFLCHPRLSRPHQGVILLLNRLGYLKFALVLETRPYNQGSRLTAYELKQSGVPFKLIADNAVIFFLIFLVSDHCY